MPKKAMKQRLDEYLLAHGHFESLKQAQAWILSGKVVVDGAVCTQAGTAVREPDVALRGAAAQYASRGGYKMEKALRALPVDARDKVALDAGAASGGFTDCLLQHGARLVYAVDVGYGQLKGRLANDPRVRNMERVNISDVRVEQLDPPIDLCVGDLSFLSLVTAFPILRALFKSPFRLIALVKPLFEGLAPGQRSDPAAIAAVLAEFFAKLADAGIPLSAVTVSPILGSRETVEFLMLADESLPRVAPDAMVEQAMRALRDEPPVALLPGERPGA